MHGGTPENLPNSPSHESGPPDAQQRPHSEPSVTGERAPEPVAARREAQRELREPAGPRHAPSRHGTVPAGDAPQSQVVGVLAAVQELDDRAAASDPGPR